MKLENKDIILKALLESKFKAFRLQAQEREIDFEVQYCDRVSMASMQGDEEKIAQVIRNIVSRAFDSAGNHGKVLVIVEMIEHAGNIIMQIQVCDSGPAISQTHQEMMFKGDKIEFTAGIIETGKVGALGLLISHGILELHHGSITYTSGGDPRINQHQLNNNISADTYINTFTLKLPAYFRCNVRTSNESRDIIRRMSAILLKRPDQIHITEITSSPQRRSAELHRRAERGNSYESPVHHQNDRQQSNAPLSSSPHHISRGNPGENGAPSRNVLHRMSHMINRISVASLGSRINEDYVSYSGKHDVEEGIRSRVLSADIQPHNPKDSSTYSHVHNINGSQKDLLSSKSNNFGVHYDRSFVTTQVSLLQSPPVENIGDNVNAEDSKNDDGSVKDLQRETSLGDMSANSAKGKRGNTRLEEKKSLDSIISKESVPRGLLKGHSSRALWRDESIEPCSPLSPGGNKSLGMLLYKNSSANPSLFNNGRVPSRRIDHDPDAEESRDSYRDCALSPSHLGMGLGMNQFKEAVERSEVGRGKRLKGVLVVDDVLMNRKLLCRLMEGHCEFTDTAEDGLVAIERMRKKINDKTPYDLVLMDYQMPHADGPTAARAMRDMGYIGPIIGVTGNVLSTHMENYIAHGANTVLQKPLDFAVLQKTILELDMGNTGDLIVTTP
mmetsp:Transcript_24668/g.24895  ORF Transcript_24668/g.24895 Transcript_24668/m.24895 type:complete len:671 (+) Transcript_24668:3-2015(+)